MPGMGREPGSPGRPCSHRACVLGWGCGQIVTGINLDEQGTNGCGGLAGRPRCVSTGEVHEGLPKVCVVSSQHVGPRGPRRSMRGLLERGI